jgi:hypothetical protein
MKPSSYVDSRPIGEIYPDWFFNKRHPGPYLNIYIDYGQPLFRYTSPEPILFCHLFYSAFGDEWARNQMTQCVMDENGNEIRPDSFYTPPKNFETFGYISIGESFIRHIHNNSIKFTLVDKIVFSLDEVIKKLKK